MIFDSRKYAQAWVKQSYSVVRKEWENLLMAYDQNLIGIQAFHYPNTVLAVRRSIPIFLQKLWSESSYSARKPLFPVLVFYHQHNLLPWSLEPFLATVHPNSPKSWWFIRNWNCTNNHQPTKTFYYPKRFPRPLLTSVKVVEKIFTR